ncbi:MAG TPA: hypothetical protein IAA26_11960 [Candidatus Blautia faecipullorum]|nr:hypothetical protein [Candidatus Blautia faecipullorum]
MRDSDKEIWTKLKRELEDVFYEQEEREEEEDQALQIRRLMKTGWENYKRAE